jgi:hypothetical protein
LEGAKKNQKKKKTPQHGTRRKMEIKNNGM